MTHGHEVKSKLATLLTKNTLVSTCVSPIYAACTAVPCTCLRTQYRTADIHTQVCEHVPFLPIGCPSPTQRFIIVATTTMAVNDMLGADVETNGVFDPLGYGKDDASLFRRRAVELKHGRVAMLAVTGYLFAEQWHPL